MECRDCDFQMVTAAAGEAEAAGKKNVHQPPGQEGGFKSHPVTDVHWWCRNHQCRNRNPSLSSDSEEVVSVGEHCLQVG